MVVERLAMQTPDILRDLWYVKWNFVGQLALLATKFLPVEFDEPNFVCTILELYIIISDV